MRDEEQRLLGRIEAGIEEEGQVHPPLPAQAGDPELPPMRTLAPILVALWVPSLACGVEGTVVTTLLESVGSTFHSAENASWLGTAFLLTLCCCTPLTSRVCESLGRRHTLLLSEAGFTLATFLCGISPSMGALIASRALAGMAAAGLVTTVSIVMSDLVPMRQRAWYQGLTNLWFSAGLGLGGPLGGWAADTVGWQAGFLLQVPLLLAALALTWAYVPEGAAERVKWDWSRVDLAGTSLLFAAIALPLVSLSLVGVQDVPLSDPCAWGGILLGLLAVPLFYLREKRAEVPILPLDLLHRPHSLNGLAHAVASLAQCTAIFAFFYTVPDLYQAVLGTSASRAGVLMLPYSLCISLGSILAGAHIRAHGTFRQYTVWASIGMCLSAACFLGGTLYLTCHAPARGMAYLLSLAAMPMSFGYAASLTTQLIALLHGVPRSAIPLATGMSYLCRQAGQVLGVAWAGAVVQTLLRSLLPLALATPDADGTTLSRAEQQRWTERLRHEPALLPTLPPHLIQPTRERYAQAQAAVYLLVLLGAALATLANTQLEEAGLDQPGPAPAHDAAAAASPPRSYGATRGA